MNCAKHPERAATLSVDLPSINVRLYECDECKAQRIAALTPYKGKREAWEIAQAHGEIDRYGMDPYGSFLHNEPDTFDRRWK